MGEVRITARLTNAIDEALVRRGTLSPDRMRSYDADAIVDTGTAHTVVPREIAARLGLAIRSRQVAYLAGGHSEEVDVTEPLIVEIDGRTTVDEALVLGDEVLIGQTVLEKLDFLVDCNGARLISNPRHPGGWGTRV
jgi:clan AA aspartic protease